MKRAKYFIFSLICLFSCSIVFAKNEITVKSMIPVYDENSGVIVTEENGVHSVIFNDKDQSVKYNVVIENTTNKDIPIDNIELPKSPEEFFKYELTGLNNGDVLKADSTKEVVISLETVKTEGWGRNFDIELTTNIDIDSSVINPNTSTKDLFVILMLVACISGTIIIVCKKNKVARYVVLIIALSSALTIAQAQEKIMLSIPLKVSFESKNVMSKSGTIKDVCSSWEENGQTYESCYEQYYPILFWEYSREIKNIYIENELSDLQNYAYKFDVSENKDGKVIAYLVEKKDDEDFIFYDLYIQADGIIYPNPNASYYFFSMSYLEKINNLEGLDTSNVTNMKYMFNGTGSNSENFNLDLSNFDTSKVTDMNCMFYGTGGNSKNFTLDISGFDTSNVTDMSGMFTYTGQNSKSFTLDVSNFDTSNVTDMSLMFDGTGNSNPNFTLDVSNFDTSKVTDMSSMFYQTGYYVEDYYDRNDYISNFTLDISGFDTSNVTDMSAMFAHTGQFSKSFTLDVSNFDTSKATDMGYMFYKTGYDNPNFTLDVSNFDTSNVTNMESMFDGTGYKSTIFTLDISNFDTSNVTDMSTMFYRTGYNNPNFTLDVTGFDTSKVTDMSGMFSDTGYNNPNFTLDVSNFDTSNVTNMRGLFSGTGQLSKSFTLDLSGFDTSKVTDMSYMFSGTGNNNPNFTLDVTGFDTSNVTDMSYMFEGTGYTSPNFTLDVSGFDTSNVTNFYGMFGRTGYNSTKLNTSITIRNANIESYNYYYMFEEVATQPGSKITVNYTSETSELVDKMIKTKSSNSNVVKGVQVD